MGKLTKQEVFESIELIDNGDYENSLVEFFEDIDELILNVTQEEKENIIKFITQQITSWNNFSYEKNLLTWFNQLLQVLLMLIFT